MSNEPQKIALKCQSREPADIIWCIGNIYSPEKGLEGKDWAWFAGNGGIVLYKRGKGKVSCRLKFKVVPFGGNRSLRVRSGEKLLTQYALEYGKSQDVLIKDLEVGPGINTIFLESSPGAEMVYKNRKVSVAITDLKVSLDPILPDQVIHDSFIDPILSSDSIPSQE